MNGRTGRPDEGIIRIYDASEERNRQPARPPSLPGREAIARIIEPTAYHLRDELAKEESSGFPDRQSAELLAGRQIDIALAKADAILSLTKGTVGTCTCGGDDDQPASHHDISCPRSLTPVTDAGREAIIEECAVAAEQRDRIGIEWVADSLWANILKHAGNNVRKLKIASSRTPSHE